ncbi:MAG TPA: DNA primase [Candidatus Fournierella excrementavium]|uniref:DNA primase n=1 Tax=Allofournierella TaxID=1940255 RepID=UPI0015AEEAD0|nr:DNA primase [Fournierella sp.]MCI6958436.1 DNA primase [Oscillospiraceae bacterium]MEE0756360.1 DNA primase [Fournierella sp.]HJD17881.1 DNA primase [Candidatus Fournierella excrementavium]
MIPREYIDEVVRRSDITEVVSSYVQLRHRGRTHTGLCPFHSEKTPSFVVYPETQSFYCFGCGAGGDVITFVRKINNLDYVEAVKMLAGRAGMPMPEEDDKAGRLRSRVLAINKEAARFFYEQLNAENDDARAARAYWRGRGLSDSTIRRFGLGFSPNDFGALRRHLRTRGYTEEEMLASGLQKRSEKGNVYDVFRGRVMTPIFDLRGNVIAFGGRVLGDEKPKYINSPETLVYKKSKAMFALNIAKKSASRRYILCEGYMDVISLHQAGFDTAVAACGTALTPDQVRLLGEYADEVVLCYDSDEAGQKATARSLGLFAESPVKVSVLNIPGAKDPDEFIKKYGRERFEALLNGTSNAIEYKLAKVREKYDLARPADRVEYIKDAIRLLAGRLTPTEREVYAGRLAEETDVAKANVMAQLEAAVRANQRRAQRQREKELLNTGAGADIKLPYNVPGGEKALGVASAEQQLVAALIRDPSLIPMAESRVKPEQFLMEDMAAAYAAVLEAKRQGHLPDLATLASALPEETVSRLSLLLARNYDVGLGRRDVEMYLDRLEQSVPQSSKAGGMTGEELEEYMERLRRKKS